MLANKLMSALSGGSEDKLYVDDVFSAYTYTGNGSTQTINNGIDLAGEGGLVWCKSRSGAENNGLFDTVRGGNSVLVSNTTNGALAPSAPITFTNNGYSHSGNGTGNSTDTTYVSWTFRKAPKFFDVVTYTGNGVAGRQITHDLGVEPGMVIVKKTNAVGAATGWYVWHRGLTSGNYILLNSTAAESASSAAAYFGNNSTTVDPTSSSFTVGTVSAVNGNDGETYVAYLFAHDTSADGFIQCGSFTTDGSGNATVNLGWEPQYVMVKCINGDSFNGDCYLLDTFRGWTASSAADRTILANTSGSETAPANMGEPISTGFTFGGIALSKNFIYLAIRRPNKPPTTGTEVYNAIARTGTGVATTVTGVGFAPDLAVITGKNADYPSTWFDRLRGRYGFVISNSTQAELIQASTLTSFDQDGVSLSNFAYVNESPAPYINHFFRRAPGFMDVVCYTGAGTFGQVIPHGLGIKPELIIIKNRSSASYWPVFTSILTIAKFLELQTSNGMQDTGGALFTAEPTGAAFFVGANAGLGGSGSNYVAYLFASAPGISKVGSYTGNGTTQTINCGFTTGARFILIKRTDSTGDWYVWDSVRGIVAGNDPHLSLNTTAAEVTTDDSVDPDVSGFIVNQVAATNINVSGGQYIFLAIA